MRLRRGRRLFGLQIRLDGTEKISYGREALIYISGPLANLISLLIPQMGDTFYAFSLGAALFNLIPFAGSDGERLICAIMSAHLSPSVSQRLTDALSLSFSVAIWLAAVIMNLYGEGSFALLVAVTLVLLSSIG